MWLNNVRNRNNCVQKTIALLTVGHLSTFLFFSFFLLETPGDEPTQIVKVPMIGTTGALAQELFDLVASETKVISHRKHPSAVLRPLFFSLSFTLNYTIFHSLATYSLSLSSALFFLCLTRRFFLHHPLYHLFSLSSLPITLSLSHLDSFSSFSRFMLSLSHFNPFSSFPRFMCRVAYQRHCDDRL